MTCMTASGQQSHKTRYSRSISYICYITTVRVVGRYTQDSDWLLVSKPTYASDKILFCEYTYSYRVLRHIKPLWRYYWEEDLILLDNISDSFK